MKRIRTLGQRLGMVYIGLIIIPFTALFLFFSLRTLGDVRNTFNNFMEQNNLYVNQQLNQVVEEVHKFASLQMLDSHIEDIIAKKRRQYGMEYIQDVRDMNGFIRSITSLKTPYYNVVYVGVNGEYYSNRSPDFDLSKDVYYQVLESHKISGKTISISPIVELYGTKSIIFTRNLMNSSTLKQEGYCMVSLSMDELYSYLTLENVDERLEGELMIFSDEEIIYRAGSNEVPNEDFFKAINTQLLNTDLNNTKTITINKERFLTVRQRNDATGWWIIQYKPMLLINRFMLSSVFVYVWTMLPLFIAFIVIAGYISRKVLKPIKLMRVAMRQLKNGKFETIDENVIQDDEMGYLMKSYNNTVRKLEKNIHDRYIAELSEKKAQLKMLESQVNPHFLYNSLNTISSIGEIHDVREVSLIAGSLSEMLRFNLQESSVVTIREELTQIENYLTIQQIRFKDKLTFVKHIDEKTLCMPILKFLIQPLIENAIYHGLEKKPIGGTVRLTIQWRKETIYVHVKDDGVGITADGLKTIQQSLVKTSKDYLNRGDYTSIGLENVNFRLKDFYGSQYSLHINSREGVFTEVFFSIPHTEQKVLQ